MEVDTARLETSRNDTVKELPGYSVQNCPSGSFLFWGGAGGGIVYYFVWMGYPSRTPWIVLRTPVCLRILSTSFISVSIFCVCCYSSVSISVVWPMWQRVEQVWWWAGGPHLSLMPQVWPQVGTGSRQLVRGGTRSRSYSCSRAIFPHGHLAYATHQHAQTILDEISV